MKSKKILYPELSYKLIGCAYQVFNTLEFGFPEKYYQEALSEELKKNKIDFEREKYVQLRYNEKVIGKMYLDFVVDKKIIVELKVKPKFGYVHIHQVKKYLQSIGYELAILIYFTRDGVKFKRILNCQNYQKQ